MPAVMRTAGNGSGSAGVAVDRSRFARNFGWNLLGQLAPLVAAAVALPLLVNSLGIDRFGVLTLSWVIIGYFSLFDLGIGRALTQVVASHVGAGRGSQVAPVVWTSLLLMTALVWLVPFCLSESRRFWWPLFCVFRRRFGRRR